MLDLSMELDALNKKIKTLDLEFNLNTNLKSFIFHSNSKLTNLFSYPPSKDYYYTLKSTPVKLRIIEGGLYVANLKIYSNSQKPIELEFQNTSEKITKKISTPFKSGSFYIHEFVIHNPITDLSINCMNGSTLIHSIEGYSLNEFKKRAHSPASLKNLLKKTIELKTDIENIKNRINSEYNTLTIAQEKQEENFEKTELRISKLNDEIEELDESKREIDEFIIEINKEKTEVLQELKKVKEQLSEEKAKLDLNTSENQKLEKQKIELEVTSNRLTKSNAEANQNLKRLQSDADVFSEDVKGFVTEARKQQYFYGFMCIVLLVLLTFTVTNIFDRTSTLMNEFDKGQLKSIWDVVISRIPFTFAFLGILALIGEGMRRAINQIIRIHEQRLSFQRISIIAREVIKSSNVDLTLDDDDILIHRTNLKLSMLRRHMEQDLGTRKIELSSSNHLKLVESDTESHASMGERKTP